MATTATASAFYKNPSIYLKSDQIVRIEDAKSHKLKSILIPEKLLEKYRFILDKELEESIIKSFSAPMPEEIAESFAQDMEKAL